MNDARPSNWSRALKALLSAIVPIIAGLGAHAVVAQTVDDLELAMTDSPDPVAVGRQLTYTITVTNNGSSDADIVVVDDLPSGVTFESASLPPGTPSEGCGPDGPQVFCSIQALATEATATLTIVVTPTAANDQLRNMARVSGTDLTVEELTKVVLPTPPTASDVSISGTPRVGEVLTGHYIYADVDGDDEGASTFRWFRGGTPIGGATAPSYALVAADEAAFIRFVVTPVALSGPSPGPTVVSAAVGPVAPPNTPPTASNVLISGTPQVGQVLTGSYLYSDVDGNDEGTSTFRWLRGTVPIAGATAQSYALVASDEGALIRFEVTPVAKSGPSPGPAVTSNPVGPVTPAPDPRTPPTASNAFISGAPQVGQVLTGSYTYADVDGDDEGASTFRWLRGTTPIAGATAKSYALVAADEGTLVSFEVTPVALSGPSPGLAATSAAVGPVTPEPNPPTPPTASDVSISGTPRVGQVLTGSYTYGDVEGDLEGASTFRWLRDNIVIAGATARSYALVAADEGALIRFEVTPVALSGPSPGLAANSAPVGPVTSQPNPPTPPTASSVFISGTPQVGQVLTGSYTYADAEGDLQGASTFRWLRDSIAHRRGHRPGLCPGRRPIEGAHGELRGHPGRPERPLAGPGGHECRGGTGNTHPQSRPR